MTAPPGTLSIAAKLRPHCYADSPVDPDEQALAVARLLIDARARARNRHQPDTTIEFVDTLTRYIKERRNGDQR